MLGELKRATRSPLPPLAYKSMFADRLLLSFAIAGEGLLAGLARALAHWRSASISSRIVAVKRAAGDQLWQMLFPKSSQENGGTLAYPPGIIGFTDGG